MTLTGSPVHLVALKPGVVKGSVGNTLPPILANFCHQALEGRIYLKFTRIYIVLEALKELRTILIAANSTRPEKGRIARYSSFLIAGGGSWVEGVMGRSQN